MWSDICLAHPVFCNYTQHLELAAARRSVESAGIVWYGGDVSATYDSYEYTSDLLCADGHSIVAVLETDGASDLSPSRVFPPPGAAFRLACQLNSPGLCLGSFACGCGCDEVPPNRYILVTVSYGARRPLFGGLSSYAIPAPGS